MIRNQHYPNASGTVALADGPPRVRTQSIQVVQELTALGLTEEASLGVLRVLLRCGSRPASVDPMEL